MKIFYAFYFSLNSKCLGRSKPLMFAYLSVPSSEQCTWYMVDTQQQLIQMKSNENWKYTDKQHFCTNCAHTFRSKVCRRQMSRGFFKAQSAL